MCIQNQPVVVFSIPSLLLFIVVVVCSSSGKGFISGHADGTIVRYFFEDDASGLSKVSIVMIMMYKC